VKYQFDYSKQKDLVLKETRNISFEAVISAYKKKRKLADFEHKRKGRKYQRMLIVEIDNYAFVVPYVIDKKRKRVFLKTIYPSQKFTQQYLK